MIKDISLLDFRDQLKKIIDYSYKYVGVFGNDNQREFLINQTEKLIQDNYIHLTMLEIGLAFRWGLDGKIAGAYELNLRSVITWLNKYSIIRRKCINNQNVVHNHFEILKFIYNNLDELPYFKQWYNEGKKRGKKSDPTKISDVPIQE